MKLLKVTITALIVFVGVFSSQSFAQDVEFKRSGNWEFLYEIEGVNFYYKNCEYRDVYNGIHQENVLVKLENTNDSQVQVEWIWLYYYNWKCYNCEKMNKIEYRASVVVDKNSSIEGVCDKTGNENLRIFSRFLNMDNPEATLTSFVLSNLKIVIK